MSDDDKDSKTELPTEKKLRDAAEKGNTPFSREITVFAFSASCSMDSGTSNLPFVAASALCMRRSYCSIAQTPNLLPIRPFMVPMPKVSHL